MISPLGEIISRDTHQWPCPGAILRPTHHSVSAKKSRMSMYDLRQSFSS